VSNSSSSSFIVGFDKKPKTIGQLFDLMFPTHYEEHVISYYNTLLPVSSVIDRVWKDMTRQLTTKQVEQEIENYASTEAHIEVMRANTFYQEESKIYNKFFLLFGEKYGENQDFKDEMKKIRDAEDLAIKENMVKYIEKARKILDGKKCFFFEYSDNNSEEESLLEHGNIFRNVPHITINNH
jgi:capsular polysaccharide biosynthesis protein